MGEMIAKEAEGLFQIREGMYLEVETAEEVSTISLAEEGLAPGSQSLATFFIPVTINNMAMLALQRLFILNAFSY